MVNVNEKEAAAYNAKIVPIIPTVDIRSEELNKPPPPPIAAGILGKIVMDDTEALARNGV